MTIPKKLVLVGNGMAGIRCIEHLLKLAPDAYSITVFGAEPHPNYNRIQLSTVLADGGAGLQDIVLNDWSWYEDNGITLHAGHPVASIDTAMRTVTSDQGVSASYDVLLLATGSRAYLLPVPGADKEGVIGFRDIRDCETMLEASRTYRRAAVIGGGLLGLEAARGLLNLGMDVTVVHNSALLMNRQLDPAASLMLQQELEQQGMKFRLNAQTAEITGRKRASGLKFRDGSRLDADLVVMAVGIVPNAELAAAAGIATRRGVIVGDELATSAPGVYALGECAEHDGIAYGLVAPLYEQGAVLAKHLAGVPTEGYKGSVTSTKLKVSGVDVFSAGDYMGGEGSRSLRWQDEVDGVYKKLVVRGDRLEGAVLFGDTSDGAMLFNLIKSGEPIAGREKELLLGFAPGSGGATAASPLERLAAMPDDEIVCGCNGVSKEAVVQAIVSGGCTSLGAIKACTKASASCGGCKPLVEGLLELTAGDAVVQVKEGICGCTALGREEIVEAISSMGLSGVRETMHVLGWSQPEGCSKCRPALNYYLGMLQPGSHRDEKESRFANERYHANIQKDGTFSVVPRIYGGVTSPAELKHIADVAERFRVPLVKFTGGQRLDLLGVRKEDLPRMWEELGMASGSAYGKALRTVKTCVGDTFCRFGTQDAMGMGIRLEKAYERISTPAKFKMAVSGCPRNCAEATIKDFGVVAIDGGWELHAGGNGGVKVRATDLIGVVRTEEEVMEWSGAFLQYYRETASWGERTAHWVERVGIGSIREALASAEERIALNERLQEALATLEDPWKEIVGDPELRKNFEPLAAAGREQA
ncbi:nitrite reductase large subunit NirB [Paenibacillus pasadenensis]|uniref:nitrite reductase large subunit NirB n=1 Tax=Paenibacillus pasadenensis TaxID=217090 RepID=UPI000400DED5|nr:nitrite reductase large subunit NirB [Paenibacillus pasadenensis]